jgi:chromosome segregation ATPase
MLVPLLVEKARIRLNREPAVGKTHELEAFCTGLTAAFVTTQFRLPAPFPLLETEAPRPAESAERVAEARPARSELADCVADFLAEFVPLARGYGIANEQPGDYARSSDQELLGQLRKVGPALRARLNAESRTAGVKGVDDAAYKILLQESEKKSAEIGNLQVQLRAAQDNAEQAHRNEQVANKLVQGLRTKHDESQARVAELSSKIKGLENQVIGLETQLRHAGSVVQQLVRAEKQRDTAVRLVEQHRREAEALRGSQSTAQREINTLRSELESARRQLTQAQSELQRQTDRLRGAEEARDRFSRERDAANEETRRLRTANEAGFRELTASRGDVERLNGLLAAAGKKVTAMEGQLEELIQEMQRWSKVEAKGLLMLQAELEQTRKSEAAANSTIQALRARSETAEAAASRLEPRISELEARVADLQTQAQDAEVAFFEVAHQLDGKLADVKRLEAESKVAAGVLAQREGDLRKLADQLRILKETCARLTRERDAAAAELDHLKSSGASAPEIAVAHGTIARLQHELDARELELQRATTGARPLPQVEALAQRLLKAQDNIRTRYADEGVAYRASLLLNHSLAHLALATAAGDEARRAAMLVNLFRIGTSLQAVEEFPAVLNSLRSLEPEIETLDERLQMNGARRPGRALFERVVNLSRSSQSGLALGPFHYDVDQHGLVYSAG